jgi:hypothetical protein
VQLGMNLSTEGAMSARLAYEQFVDEVAFAGDTTLGIEGLYNTTGISSAAAAQAFSAATPAQILVTVNTAINAAGRITLVLRNNIYDAVSTELKTDGGGVKLARQ